MAEWIEATDSPFGGWRCSECGYFNWPGKLTPFCPYCGTTMENPCDDLLESVRLLRKRLFKRYASGKPGAFFFRV